MRDVNLIVRAGECVALTENSDSGESTHMRMIYGNYLTQEGEILIGDLDVLQAKPRDIIELRETTLGYVSQFLRVVPRVSTLNVVAEPLFKIGMEAFAAGACGQILLERRRIRKNQWKLSRLTFSGGEQQRVNIARGFAHTYPAVSLDESAASLDAKNRETILSPIEEAKARSAAIIGIFHDEAARDRIRDQQIAVLVFTPKVAA